MIDKFAILSKGGIVLWSITYASYTGDPIDSLIKTVLLEGKAGSEKTFSNANFMVEWTLNNELELIFVVVYQKILQLLYVEELLQLAKESFCSYFGEILRVSKTPDMSSVEPFAFESQFEKIRRDCEKKAVTSKQQKSVQRSFHETKKGKEKKERESGKKAKKAKKKKKKRKTKNKNMSPTEDDDDDSDDDNEDEEDEEEEEEDEEEKEKEKEERESNNNSEEKLVLDNAPTPASGTNALPALDKKRLIQMAAKRRKGKKSIPSSVTTTSTSTKKSSSSSSSAKGKKARRWDENDNVFAEFTQKAKEKGLLKRPDVQEVGKGPSFKVGEKTELNNWNGFFEREEANNSSSDDENENVAPSTVSSGWSIGSLFSGLTNRVLTRKDLQSATMKLRESLIEKNVASEIADELCESVCNSLEGKSMSSFKRIRTEVKNTMEQALTRILTPKHNVDILREITRVTKNEKRPYTITFIGVNGVGKSTNLAKVCYYLMQQSMKVMITACDTFRSGAVEQLKTHARNLEVPLFERGYEKDPAFVAMQGIAEGKQNGMDVVLIDTAGRMQDNRPLMTALAKLVYSNNPDLILFVGEALVGNEAVDQLKRFNQALEEFAPAHVTNPRLIDGIILTKFDTIDTKVGAAISMVYTTGQPIIFVGTGQNYTDLKRMNIATVVRALLN